MKRLRLLLAASGALVAATAGAQAPAAYDSLRVEHLQEVVVSGVRAQRNAPFATTNIKKRELNAHAKTGRELPFLFAQTPGVVAWSENGLGTGTTYMRIRGAGDSRVNVTLDGVPLNSPEDQCVFWANMNSYGTLLGSVQIQRGVGTSTNGDGAFGGTVALSSATPSPKPQLEVSVGYGSYNTLNVGGNFSTGLLFDHLIFDGAYHETSTDGFMHGTDGRSGSYYGGLRWVGTDWTLSYKNIGNFEKTGQAWNGVTTGDDYVSLMDGIYGVQTGITTYKGMYDHGLGRYNSLYEHLVHSDPADPYSSFVQDANGNYKTERYQMSNGTQWPRTTDNFWQNHNLLTLAGCWGDHWSGTATARYTYGSGYYREFRPNNKLSKFGLENFATSDGTLIKRSDFVRKKGLTQNAYGLVGSLNYKDEKWDVIGGLSVQEFVGNHYGYLTYMANAEMAARYLADGKYTYYDSDAEKLDASAYLKAAYQLTEQWSVFGDVQYRHVNYATSGINDKFYEAGNIFYNQPLDIDEAYNFFNPKAGVSFRTGGHHAYASAAISHREPERNNFTDNGSYPFPKAERLLDLELGYTWTANRWRVGVNGYYMDYDNQFVQTGEESDIGEKLTTNVKKSYRLGVELQAGVDPTSWLTLEGNAALSQNKIKDFDEVVEDWDNGWATYHYDNSTLAFSPSTVLNGFANIHFDGLQLTWHTNFVSRQYLDNSENAKRSLPCYSQSDVAVSYTTPLKSLGIREAVFALNFNNVFNRRYAANAWVYSAVAESYGLTRDNRYYQIGYIPMAGFTMMGNVTLRF